ncbi:unnamed protein product [Sphagnum jensenii]|uniref:Uncharacterized protein n=1 Tax=Sphagnum jensenii TaxID=128206 RepID=A0ABP1BI67_9BRYO
MVLSLPALAQTAALRLRSYPRGFPSIPTRGLFVQLPTMAATSPARVPAAKNFDQVETSSSQSKPEQKLGNVSAIIIPHLFKLYDCTATAADYEIYAPRTVFEDPLTIRYLIHLILSVQCETDKITILLHTKDLKNNLPEVSQIFKEAQIVECTITEEETAPGSGGIRIH